LEQVCYRPDSLPVAKPTSQGRCCAHYTGFPMAAVPLYDYAYQEKLACMKKT